MRSRKILDISLRRAELLNQDSLLITVDDSQDYGEVRYKAIGFIGAKLYTFIYTMRAAQIRAISLRQATKQEEKIYADEA